MLETIFLTVVIFLTCGMFATLLTRISKILDDMELQKLSYNKNREILFKFFKTQPVSESLQGILLNQINYLYIGHNEKRIYEDLDDLLKLFPENQQQLVRKERFSQKVKQFSVLCENFTEKTIAQLDQIVQEEYFMPNQYIFNNNVERNYDNKLYLITKGSISLQYYTPDNKTKNICTLHCGDYFNEKSFFSALSPIYTAKTQGFCTLLSIERQTFLDIIQDSEKDKEMFQVYKDKIINDNHHDLTPECKICNQNLFHFEENCNIVHYRPLHYMLCQRHSFSQPILKRKYQHRR